MPAERLAAALAAAQADFPPLARSKHVTVQTKTGGSYSFDYAPLDAIVDAVRPVLAKHGLAFSQPLATSETGLPALRSILLHASGETLEATVPLPIRSEMSAQEIGSTITYLRRYALTSLLGLATEEDDDGNHARGNGTTERRSSAPRNAPPMTPNAATPKLATERQLALLHVLIGKLVEQGQDADAIKAAIKETHGVESSKQLTRAAISEEIERLKALAEPAPASVTGDPNDDIPF